MFRRSDIDKNWLVDEYVLHGHTIQQIAGSLGCSYATARAVLLEAGVQLRNSHYSQRVSKGFPAELEQRKWIYDQYIVQEKSLNEIALELGIQRSVIRSSLVRFGITLRTKSEGQRLRYKQAGYEDYFVFNKAVIEGCLLGDGFLKITNKKGEDVYPVFAKRNIHQDHLRFVAKGIFEKDGENRIKNRGANGGYLNAREIFEISTLSHLELLPLYQEWYPESNNFKKVVPRSITVNGDMLLHWFLDDGYSFYVVYRNKYRYLRIQFATQSFEFEELEELCGKIKEKLGITLYVRIHRRHGKVAGTGCFVEVSQTDNQKFFEIIGPCPTEVPGMAYKWKR